MTDRPLEDSGLLAKNANKQKKKKKKKIEKGGKRKRTKQRIFLDIDRYISSQFIWRFVTR